MKIAWVLSFLVLSGCASYQSKIDKPFSKLVNRDPVAAAEILKAESEKEGNDQLVYMLEYGIALHEAGRYEESSRVFLKAADIADIKDYHSISRIAGSLLLDETVIQYKGEDFEKVLIHVYLAINFLLMNKLDDAAVEARQVNEILYKFKNEAKRDYTQNPFARYLSAIIWENDRKWDDMYIDYLNTHELAPGFKPIQEDLIWGAKRAQRAEDNKKWKTTFAGVTPSPLRDDKDAGEVVIIYQQGLGPQKRPDPGFDKIPHLYPRYTNGTRAKAEVVPLNASSGAELSLETDKIFSITDTSMKTLNDQYAAMIAKKIGGVAVKAVVADQIRQKSKVLGDIAWVTMLVADRADLRQWATLPESFQIARRFLKAGKYKIRIYALDSSGQPTGETMGEKEIEIQPRKKLFLTWRSFK